MTKNNIISSTLLASALTISSLGTIDLSANQQIKKGNVSSNIASILYSRGLDKEVAQDISKNFIDDEELFASRVNNLEKGCGILSRNEILDYLSKAALCKKSVQLDSYSYLVGMVYDIKEKPLSREILDQLKNIAIINA
ncbi:MAG: hypothetical protein L3I99_01080 [Sulfurimonas sp.]|nr:hypothetical protein [Sulfurimonas sp.]